MFLEPEFEPNARTGQASSSSILVVDDDSDVRSLTRTFLEHEGYHVYTSGEADRAANIFRRAANIDLLITDYYMPHRSGMELALELKALQPSLPVLVISGALLDPFQLSQLRSQGWNFLAKPFSLPQLLANVHEILQLPHLRAR
ncbi:response regulator [Granulicella sp. dw_53]|uniref:response regulator n=1 Tax=Granulicella sp. dw_53 TaxID=2719792 RepID=UPI001BD48A78|nr:response regulator [Granulicella sp. dw_53]